MTYLATDVEADLAVARTDEQRVLALLPVAQTMAGTWAARHRLFDTDDVFSDAHLALVAAVNSWDRSSNLLHWAKFKISRGFVDGLRERRGKVSSDEAQELMRRNIVDPLDLMAPVGDGEAMMLDLVVDNDAVCETDQVELHLDLSRAMRHLGESSRQLVHDHYLAGLSMAEATRRQGLTPRMGDRMMRSALAALGEYFGLAPVALASRESALQRQWRELASSRTLAA